MPDREAAQRRLRRRAAGSPTPRTVSSARHAERAVDLLAQVAHVDVDHVRAVLVAEVPGVLEQLEAGQHLARAAHERLEQRELLRRERRSSVSPRQAWRVAGSRRRSPTSSTAGRSCWPRRASARRRAEQLGERERLGQVVVGAAVEAGHAVLDRVARREHQHRRPDAVVAQPPAGLEAVDARQHHVQDDRVVGRGRRPSTARPRRCARRRPRRPPRSGRGAAAPPSSRRPRRRAVALPITMTRPS